MTTTIRSTITLAAFVASMLPLAGCTTERQVISQYTNEEVWAAMIDVAKHPDYNDPDYTKRWTVRENNAWVDEPEHRIEIYRRVERVLQRPGTQSMYEEREWRFEVRLEWTDKPEDREVTFISRGVGVPAHAQYEAHRYQNQLWETLGGKPASIRAEEAAATQPAPPTSQAAPPIESTGPN